jgi:hypothetical protein
MGLRAARPVRSWVRKVSRPWSKPLRNQKRSGRDPSSDVYFDRKRRWKRDTLGSRKLLSVCFAPGRRGPDVAFRKEQIQGRLLAHVGLTENWLTVHPLVLHSSFGRNSRPQPRPISATYIWESAEFSSLNTGRRTRSPSRMDGQEAGCEVEAEINISGASRPFASFGFLGESTVNKASRHV